VGDLLLHLAHPERRPKTGIKNRQDALWRGVPSERSGLEEIGQGAARGPHRGRQRDAGEKRRPGGSDIGVGGLEQAFRFKNIGAAQEHLGRSSGRNIRKQRDDTQLLGQQVSRHGRVHQQVQGVFILSLQRRESGGVHCAESTRV